VTNGEIEEVCTEFHLKHKTIAGLHSRFLEVSKDMYIQANRLFWRPDNIPEV